MIESPASAIALSIAIAGVIALVVMASVGIWIDRGTD